MKSRIALIFAAVSVTFISGCCCILFEDQTPGTIYHVGDVITSTTKEIEVEQFQWGNSIWTSSGSAEVDTQNYSKGSGNDLNANNVNLRFLFDYPVNEITLQFGDLGGNSNIKVNNDFRNVPDIMNLNGAMIGGVQVTINAIQQGANWYGKMTLDGNINEFVIGGQELWIDNICCDK